MLDILCGAPNPNYKFFGDGPVDIEDFLRSHMLTTEQMRNQIEAIPRTMHSYLKEVKEILGEVDCDYFNAQAEIQHAINVLQYALMLLARREALKEVVRP